MAVVAVVLVVGGWWSWWLVVVVVGGGRLQRDHLVGADLHSWAPHKAAVNQQCVPQRRDVRSLQRPKVVVVVVGGGGGWWWPHCPRIQVWSHRIGPLREPYDLVQHKQEELLHKARSNTITPGPLPRPHLPTQPFNCFE